MRIGFVVYCDLGTYVPRLEWTAVVCKSQCSFPSFESKYRLWSLLDMAQRFRMNFYATVIAQLRESAAVARFVDPRAPDPRSLILAALHDANAQFADVAFISGAPRPMETLDAMF